MKPIHVCRWGHPMCWDKHKKSVVRFCSAWVKCRDALGGYRSKCFNRALKGSRRCRVHQVPRVEVSIEEVQ